MAYRNSNVVGAASKISRRSSRTKAITRGLANKYKHASTASKSRQGKTCQNVQAPNCWKTRGVPFSDFLLFVLCGHDFLLNDKLGRQAINVIEVKLTSQNLQVMHKSALVGKNTPMTQVVQGKG
jgi:hypothetical protein